MKSNQPTGGLGTATPPRLARSEGTAPPAQAPAIEVDELSVSYRIKLDNTSIWADLRDLVRPRGANVRIVPALRDVTFSIEEGSVTAIIGRNGAGKTTLLRTVSGALAPEAGRVVVRGRMNLLTPGVGFNPSLTGRENIWLGGLAAGIPEDRLTEITDAIADFAELDEYIEYPFKTYSSGMKSRLGFAVAAYLDPEVLLIDEALSAGDAAFASKAGKKMAELCGHGRTILLVTHSLATVRMMATHALWLHQGKVVADGDPDEVSSRYMRYCRLEKLEF